MSEENVDTVRRLYRSFTEEADSWGRIAGPGLVVDFSRRLIDPFVVRADDEAAVAALETDWSEAWETRPGWEPREVIDAGDKVVALIRFSGKGKISGANVEAMVWNVWRFENGQPVELTYFGENRTAAMEAAGLA